MWTNLREGAASYNRNTHRQNRQDRLEQEEQHQLQSAQRQLKLASTTAAGGSGSGTVPHLTKAASRARSSGGAANGGTRQGPHGPQPGLGGGGGGGMAPLATDGSAGGGWEEQERPHRYDEDDEDEISASEILKTAIVHIQVRAGLMRGFCGVASVGWGST